MRGPWARLCASLIALALVAVACGDDGGEDAATGEESASGNTGDCDSPGVSEDTIEIGQLSSLSTPAAAYFGQHQAGFKARLEAQNAEGGVGGRKLDIVAVDDGADIARATAAGQELVEQRDVFAIMVASSVTAGPGQYLHDAGVPVVGANYPPEFGMFDSWFGYSGSSKPGKYATETNGKFLAEQGATRLAILGYAQTSAQAAAEGMAVSFDAAGGEVVYNSTDAPIGNEEWTAEANQIVESGADALYVPIQTAHALSAAAAVRQAGADLKVILFPAGYSPTTIDQAGQAAEGVYFSTDLVPFEHELPVHERALAAFEEHVPDAPRSQEVLQGWAIGELLIRGLEEAGADCPTREAFIENLRQVSDWDADGLLNPSVDLEESFGKPYGLCFHYVKIEGGEFVPVTDGEAICGEELPI